MDLVIWYHSTWPFAWGMKDLGFSILHFCDFILGWTCLVCVQTSFKLGIVLWQTYLSSTSFKLGSTLTSSYSKLTWVWLLSSSTLPWHHLLASLLEFNFFQALLYLDIVFWQTYLSWNFCTSLECHLFDFFLLSALVGEGQTNFACPRCGLFGLNALFWERWMNLARLNVNFGSSFFYVFFCPRGDEWTIGFACPKWWFILSWTFIDTLFIDHLWEVVILVLGVCWQQPWTIFSLDVVSLDITFLHLLGVQPPDIWRLWPTLIWDFIVLMYFWTSGDKAIALTQN